MSQQLFKTHKIHKLNESYSIIDSDKKTIQSIFEFLKVERPGSFFDPLVKAGFKSPYEYFSSIQHGKLLIMNGHVQLLKNFGFEEPEEISDYSNLEVQGFLDNVLKQIPFEPYDFQIKSFKESIQNIKQINRLCTSAGKSLTISLICEFFRLQGKKGLLLVPNINLLTQFHSDILDYGFQELHQNTHIIGGGRTDRDFSKELIISTWQSLLNYRSELDQIDYLIVDEVHRFAGQEVSGIIKETVNCKYKFGFTGTIPEDPCMKMQLVGLFGLPKTYITSSELIDRGLATPIQINTIFFKYSSQDKRLFSNESVYLKQLQFIKEHQVRSKYLVKLVCKLKEKGNTLLLFQHTLHGKQIFTDVMKELHPEQEVQNKDITGKKSFDFQKLYGVYFLNGEDDSKTREKTRLILESHEDALVVANFAILSTGVNIRKLHNMVLASPMKSYTTITQSIGRMMRLHESKKIAQVYDIVDDFPIFRKQYSHRVNTSYNREEFPIKKYEVNLF